MGEAMQAWRQWVYGESLYLALNFVVSLIQLKKKVSKNKKKLNTF